MAKKTNQMKDASKEAGTKESSVQPPDTTVKPPEEVVKEITVGDLANSIFSGYGEAGTDVLKKEFSSLLSKYLKQETDKFEISKKYNIIILYDDTTIVKSDADKIYNAVTTFKDHKPLFLILYSRGGAAGPAYLIGKLCREYCSETFVVTVPRMAKSAATLICCAANEIHLGSLSELGPIDPQIKELPALGLKNSIEHIAGLVKLYPESSDMFAKYLHYSLDLINLGYYERVAESAMQYAEKLLMTHSDNLPRKAREIAEELVYKYKDHGFVIDKTEAEQIFGNKIIKIYTKEYELGNMLYKTFDLVSYFLNFLKYSFYFIGSVDSEPNIRKKT